MAFAKVYASWGRVRRADHPEAYVRRIVLNQVLGSRRYGFARHERPHDSVGDDRAVASPESGIVERDAVWAAVQTLPPRQRAVVVLLSDHGEGLGDHGEAEHGVRGDVLVGPRPFVTRRVTSYGWWFSEMMYEEWLACQH